ncbi:MAG: nitroreductase family protein [Promethearchaeota archaeon]
MDFYDVIRKRRSYRIYTKKMPSREKIDKILECTRLAPTWANKQGMHYIVVQDPENVKEIWKAIGQKTKFTEVPMYIVGCIAEKGSGTGLNGIKYYTVDFGICFEHLVLAATAEGLATCWVGFFNEKKIKNILSIPDNYRVLGLTPLGYSIKKKEEIIDRHSLDKIVHFEKF